MNDPSPNPKACPNLLSEENDAQENSAVVLGYSCFTEDDEDIDRERFEKITMPLRDRMLDQLSVDEQHPQYSADEPYGSLIGGGSYFIFESKYGVSNRDLCKKRDEQASKLIEKETRVIASPIAETDQEYIMRQSKLFANCKQKFVEEFRDQYVLFQDGEVLEHGYDRAELALKAYEKGGVRPLFIKKVIDEDTSSQKSPTPFFSNDTD